MRRTKLLVGDCRLTAIANVEPRSPRRRSTTTSCWKIRREALEHSQIIKTLHMLTDVYGPRLTGSPNAKAAAEWVVKRTTEWGLKNAHLEPWDFGHPGWLNERTSAFLIAPVEGLAGRRSAGVDAGHQWRRHRVGGPDRRRRDASRKEQLTAYFDAQPREGERQDRDVRPADERAGHDQQAGTPA